MATQTHQTRASASDLTVSAWTREPPAPRPVHALAMLGERSGGVVPALSSSTETSRELQELSLYRLVASEAQARNVPMRELGRKDAELHPAQAGFFDASVRAMQYWCRLNESLVLERHAHGATVYAGFERLSRVKPVARRYKRLASAVHRLTIFGEADAELAFSARTVDVSGAALAREWFLIIDAPSYKTLLVARDQLGFGPTGPLAGRRFLGLSTHDARLVQTACTALERWLR